VRQMRRAGIRPKVTSMWRSSGYQAELHKCSLSRRCRLRRGVYGAMPPGRSLHEAGLAVDIAGVSARSRGRRYLTPRGRRIVRIMERNGFKWRYGLADPAHFEANPRKVGYRNAAQAIRRTQTTCQVRLASAKRVHPKSRASITHSRPRLSRQSNGKKRRLVATASRTARRSGSRPSTP
jgi:hypothetical protein